MPVTVRYTRTDDGVNLAFTDIGQGEPIVYALALPWSNFSVGFANPCTARHPEEISSFARLIVYDPRGCGLSDHNVDDLTLDGLARDIDAVAGAAGLDRFTLYGSGDGSRVAIHYAATRPERVSRLILWLPSVSPDRLRADPVMRAIAPLAYRDWELYLRTLSHAVVGGWDTDRAPYADAFADLVRHGIPREEYPRFVAAMAGHDVAADLAKVRAPTLAMTREHAAVYTVDVVREVAAGIPDAEFVCTPGNWLLPCTGDDITRQVARFMGATLSTDIVPPRPELTVSAVAPSVNGHAATLSPREREVVELVARGMTNAKIAGALVVSHATAARHVHNILNKLGMSRRAEIAAYAAVTGLAPTPDRS
jgi:pimeloyl-ACP methyl ester carboxylesterase/DNA-binding CsgD family transcriptional regulator